MKNTIMVAALLVTIIFFCLGCMSTEATEPQNNIQMNVETENVTENANSNLGVPKVPRQNLIVYSTPAKYSYQDLVSDIQQLQNLYGNIVQVSSLCTTLDGREVFDVTVGTGDNHILIFGAMHAREYITIQIVMRQLCDAIDAMNGYGGTYQGISTAELLQDVTIHFVPNSNPDGVAISQFGLSAINSDSIRQKISAMGGDFEQWKANANGVDLNRNFDADWQNYHGAQYPSSERYKGIYPGSELESAALIKLVKDYNVKRTISYHSCGEVIYWYYKQQGAVFEESKRFAQRISGETGYYLDADYTALDPAGFKDWAVYKLGIPSLTIETGAENGASIVAPVPISRFNNIWQRNKNVVYATIYNLKYE